MFDANCYGNIPYSATKVFVSATDLLLLLLLILSIKRYIYFEGKLGFILNTILSLILNHKLVGINNRCHLNNPRHKWVKSTTVTIFSRRCKIMLKCVECI